MSTADKIKVQVNFTRVLQDLDDLMDRHVGNLPDEAWYALVSLRKAVSNYATFVALSR